MANVTAEELDLRLIELAEGLGLSVAEFVEAGYVNKATYTLDVNAIKARLDAIDVFNESDNVETVVERLEALRNVFENADGDLITTVINDIAANKADVEAEVARATAAEAVLDGKITAVDAKVTAVDAKVATEKTRAQGVEAGLDSRLVAEEAKSVTFAADLAVLKGDETVAGSVAYAVKAEADRSKAVDGKLEDLTTNVKTNLVAAINEVKAGIAAGQNYADSVKNALEAAIAIVDGKVTATQAELDATQAAIGLGTDGSFSPIDGSDTLLEYIKNTDGDVDSVIKALKKLAKSAKAADLALAAKIAAEKTRAEAKEAELQSQINTLSGGNTTSISDLTEKVTTIESEINDKTVDGHLVKGLKSKVADLESSAIAEVAAREAGGLAILEDAKAYADDNYLGVPQIQSLDICGAVNKFRDKLSLAPIVCDGSSNGGNQGGTVGGGL